MNAIISPNEETKRPGLSSVDEYDIKLDNNIDIRSERLLLRLTKRIEHSELDINYLKVIHFYFYYDTKF